MQALQANHHTLEQEKERLAQSLQARQSAVNTAQHESATARRHLAGVMQDLSEVQVAQETAAQVRLALTCVYA